MDNHNSTSRNIDNHKCTGAATQMQTIFSYLEINVCTATMLSNATGVPQKCITRYKRDLEKVGKLAEVKKGYCKVTGRLAWYITTDKEKFPVKPTQLPLFGNDQD